MDFNDTPEQAKFRAKCKEWLDANAELKDTGKRLNVESNLKDLITKAKAWQKKKYEAGWAMLHWPKEYGGINASPIERIIWGQEESKYDVPGSVFEIGLGMCGPVMMQYASEDQKERYLPPMAEGKEIWCQLFSEPSAGSDVAGLRSKAVKDGDHYIVNGTKTWTTMAQHADWIFCLVRTETTDIKQQGISFLLIDMKTPGVEVKPIITIDGSHEVNMVYLDNVKVPAENLIGEEGAGWNIAKFLLAHERTGIGGIPALKREIRRLREITSELPLGEGFLKDDDLFMDKLNKLEIDLLAAEYSELRTLAAMSKGGHPGPESSILKIKGTDLQQGLSDLFVEALGYYAHPFMSEDDLISNEGRIGPDFAANVMPHYLNYRKVSIYGGSNEIQRNVIAKAVLGI